MEGDTEEMKLDTINAKVIEKWEFPRCSNMTLGSNYDDYYSMYLNTYDSYYTPIIVDYSEYIGMDCGIQTTNCYNL